MASLRPICRPSSYKAAPNFRLAAPSARDSLRRGGRLAERQISPQILSAFYTESGMKTKNAFPPGKRKKDELRTAEKANEITVVRLSRAGSKRPFSVVGFWRFG
jgi:hypothetical protein